MPHDLSLLGQAAGSGSLPGQRGQCGVQMWPLLHESCQVLFAFKIVTVVSTLALVKGGCGGERD